MQILNRPIIGSALALSLLTVAHGASGDVIFSDDFTTVPSSNGYTIEGGSDFTTTAVTGAEVNPPSNTAVRVAKTASGEKVFTITRSINASDFENIAIEFEAFQTQTTYEQGDNLRILVRNVGEANFTEIFRNPGPFDDDNDDSNGSGGFVDSGVRQSTSTGLLNLGSEFNDSIFDLRIGITVNANSEQYYFDNLTVTGDVIPEPGSLALLGFGLATLAVRRARKNRSAC